MAKRLAGFNLDDRSALFVTGFLQTMGEDLGRTKHMAPVIKYVFAKMDSEFSQQMSRAAVTRRRQFHHVYEWHRAGDPTAELFNVELRGTGTRRNVTFNWRASKSVVPLPEDVLNPGSNGKELKHIHVFVWKAPMMEYRMDVNITTNQSEVLAFPSSEGYPAMNEDEDLFFTKGPVRRQAGDKFTAGSFSREFLNFWAGTGGNEYFDQYVQRALENDIGNEKVAAVLRMAKRFNGVTSPKGMKSADRVNAIKSGKKQAEAFLRERDNTYVEVARNRQLFKERFAGGERDF